MRRKNLLVKSSAVVASLLLFANSSHAWDTPEHIAFGNHISDPFAQQVFKQGVPVLAMQNGPQNFGHWVSAPDFARSMTKFLKTQPVAGDLACSTMWEEAGLGTNGWDDQLWANEPDSLKGQRAQADCIDAETFNNNHFGDFALDQYKYYHQLALVAASTYRYNHQASCQTAAYTLEAWSQHHLTDSTAAGHAWNPPGRYDNTWSQSAIALTGIPVRMHIHDYLNTNGAKMANSYYAQDTFWGDHSEMHTAEGTQIPDQADNVQSSFTMRLARMSLGQIISAAECGADPLPARVLESSDDSDPRRVYVSNQSMCQAMVAQKLMLIDPNNTDTLLGSAADKLWLGTLNSNLVEVSLKAAADACTHGDDSLASGSDLAELYFQEKLRLPKDAAAFSHTLDPKGAVQLSDFGCTAAAPQTPDPNAGQLDACGNALCAIAPAPGNVCPRGLTATAGCCYPSVTLTDDADVAQIQSWNTVSGGGTVDLPTEGATAGESSEFLWFNEAGMVAPQSDYQPFATTSSISLSGSGETITECGKMGSFSVFETRVKIPRTNTYGGNVLALTVNQMDEGLKIQVNGQLVRYLAQADGGGNRNFSPVRVPLLTNEVTPLDDGSYVIRLTHLNDCGEERPLQVALSLDSAKADGIGPQTGAAPSTGCSLGGTPSTTSAELALALLSLFALASRRRRVAIVKTR